MFIRSKPPTEKEFDEVGKKYRKHWNG